jgi:hypothetical protein
MVGSQFTMKLNARGEFRSVRVPATVVKALKDIDPEGATLGDEESQKALCTQSLVIFPEAPIARGGSWRGVRKERMLFGTMVADTTYNLDGASGPVENIRLEGKVFIEPTKGSTFEIEMRAQEMSGQYHFDNLAGVLKTSNVVQKMSMILTVGGHPVPTEYESSSKLEMKGDGSAK